MDLFSLSSKTHEICKACELLYGDRRPEIKANYREILEKHKIENNTNSLLSSAIRLSGKDDRRNLVLIGAAFE